MPAVVVPVQSRLQLINEFWYNLSSFKFRHFSRLSIC